jgi:hypothetical protein
MIDNFKFWIRIAIFNLLIVALFGVIMRYKIGFEFPYFNQKNLQHAHSHFAFGGWISLMIMILMLYSIKEKLTVAKFESFKPILFVNLITAYGMLISFAIEGYALFSISFSTLSIIISFWFTYTFYSTVRSFDHLPGLKWMNFALLFNLISSFGTLSLSYMMATKQIEQHSYLASVYWYLHFQYNGWFFFACMGLFVNFLFSRNINLINESISFKLLALTCIPAYGLSVLWLNLPLWIYIIVVVAAIAQFYGLFIFMKELLISKFWVRLELNQVSKILLICVAFAITTKVTLQAGSTIPAISKFAFGFRPIVIAYLHLVLLAFTSVFLMSCAYLNELITDSKVSKIGLITFVMGILFNELILAIQGIFSISYTMIPFANEMLFTTALIMFAGLGFLNYDLMKQKN